MEMTRSETSHKCIQIWYECNACGSHLLSSTPSEIFEVREVLNASAQAQPATIANRRFHVNGASIN